MSEESAKIRWLSVARSWLFYSGCLAIIALAFVGAIVWLEWYTRPSSSGATSGFFAVPQSTLADSAFVWLATSGVSAATPWFLYGASRSAAAMPSPHERAIARWLTAPSALGLTAIVVLSYRAIFG